MNRTKYSSQKFIWLLILLDCAIGSQVSNLFSKMHVNVMENYCLLTTQVPASVKFLSLRGACSHTCQQTSDCHFFCLSKNAGTCALFSALVALRWKGYPASGTSTTYDACYTSWGNPHDIVKTNSPFASSPNFGASDTQPVFATDGYACLANPYRFVTKKALNNFSQIDLEQITRVQTVIVATMWAGYFLDIDVILSNTSDFTLGQKIGGVIGDTPAWSTYSFYTNISVAGRYITIFSTQNNPLGYVDIQVIAYP